MTDKAFKSRFEANVSRGELKKLKKYISLALNKVEGSLVDIGSQKWFISRDSQCKVYATDRLA